MRVETDQATVMLGSFVVTGSDKNGWALTFLNPFVGEELIGENYPNLEAAKEAATKHLRKDLN